MSPEKNNVHAFLHASRSSDYRTPFGAQPTDSRVAIHFDAPGSVFAVTFCYSYGMYGFTYQEEPMVRESEKDGIVRYRTDISMPHESGLVFYWFKFRMAGDDPEFPSEFLEKITDIDRYGKYLVYYVAEGDTDFGSGKLYFEPPRIDANEDKYPYAWQITVFSKDYRTPDSMKGAMMYQVFPDRFNRGSDFNENQFKIIHQREERIYHDDWYEDVDIKGKESTGYLACDFFGGTLTGIAEKMDYIKSLGIDILYLNPIFEARSNHRYDTADYLNVDPMLGGNEGFAVLQKAAEERGIRIVLDGVFSHTGADSRYFNKFNRYDGVGAYEAYQTGKESMFRSWYSFFDNEKGETAYESWWGFPDLPNVNENNLSYRNFIFGKDGVIRTWIKRGVSGFRLDVSDELPDGFIRQMRDTIKEEAGPEGIIIGEVWEDASNKCSYGSYRDFMHGNTHDAVMGYTFRKTVLDFLCGYIDARVFNSRMEGFRERYPAESYYANMNLISSHDSPRAMTMLNRQEDNPDRNIQKDMYVPKEKYAQVTSLMRLAYAIQIGYIGMASLYYGDEILSEGYKDPFNRRTYPWGRTTKAQDEQLEFTRKIARLRTDNDVLRTGFYRTLYAKDDFYIFERYVDEEGKDFFGNFLTKGAKRVILIINRSYGADALFDFNNGIITVTGASGSDIIRRNYIENVKTLNNFNTGVKALSFKFIFE